MRRRLELGLMGALAAASVVPGAAHASEYRRIGLRDGRSLVAEVIETDSTGILLRVPQGRIRVEYDDLNELETVDRTKYLEDGTWMVLLLPFDRDGGAAAADALLARQALAEQLRQVPSTLQATPEDLQGDLSSKTAAALLDCDTDLRCAVPLAREARVDVVLAGTLTRTEHGSWLALSSAWTSADPAAEPYRLDATFDLSQPDGTAREVLSAAYGLLGLLPEPSRLSGATMAARAEAVEVAAPTGPRPATRWLPLPGAPALAERDTGGFLRALAIAVPASGGAVYLAGRSATNDAELIALSVFSYYTISVATNLAAAPRGSKSTAAPAVQMRAGPGQIGVQGSF